MAERVVTLTLADSQPLDGRGAGFPGVQRMPNVAGEALAVK
jgi:hypothetical protein